MATFDPFYTGVSEGFVRAGALLDGYGNGFAVTWYVEEQQPLENQSLIHFSIFAERGLTTEELSANGATYVTVTINGVPTPTYSFRYASDGESFNVWFQHDEYGQFYLDLGIEYENYGEDQLSGSAAERFAVKGMPRDARIHSSPVAFNDEDNPVVTYDASATETTLFISTNSNIKEPDIVISRRVPTTSKMSYVFELTEDERDELRLRCKTANSMKLFFGIYYYKDGQALYSFRDAIFSVINATPTATGTVKDINPATIALTGDENTLIRFASTASVSAQFSAYKQAAITGYWIEHNSNIFPETTHTFEKVEGNLFAFHITDSRGNIGESLVQSPMIDYLKLTCNMDTTERPDTDGVMNIKCSGNYFNDTFGYTDAAVMNTLLVQYRYRQPNQEFTDWIDIPYTLNNDGTYDAATVLSGLVYTNTYIFQCRAIDKLSDIETDEYTAKSLPVFHWGENDFVFEVPVTFNVPPIGVEHPYIPDYSEGGTMDGDLDITGNLRLKGAGNYGNSIFFGDREYASIQELTDDTLTIKASTINLDGTLKVKNQPIEYGTWFPTLNDNLVSSYTTNKGWYQRFGNVVTVGFFVKASCKTTSTATGIAIDGLPYTPTNTASGGGMCSGARIAIAQVFQCWAANVDGTITSRTQGGPQSVASNISTSSGGLWYPFEGGEITLSGTITYVTW